MPEKSSTVLDLAFECTTMAKSTPFRSPKYRFHKARQCAVVTIGGRDHYLGPFESQSSWEQYHRLVAEHFATKAQPITSIPADAPLTVTELIAKYWQYAKSYYVKNGQPTSEVATIKLSLRFVRQLYGSIPAAEFSPKKLKVVREAMIRHDIARTVSKTDPNTGITHSVRRVYRHGLARRCINKLIARVRRMYAWGVEEELVAVDVHAALLRVRGLKKGSSTARESERIRPVSPDRVLATLPHVSPTIAAMIQLQQLCGGRPQDIVQLRMADIDRSGPIWEYRPRSYKTEHHNVDQSQESERVLFFGPLAQQILSGLNSVSEANYLFCQRHTDAARQARRKEQRVTPMTPSQAARIPRGRKLRPFGDHYSVGSYRRAIQRGCLKAGIDIWSPNQLRHSRLTEIRKLYGLEASRVVGGHSEIGVTQHYAERDYELAKKVMADVG